MKKQRYLTFGRNRLFGIALFLLSGELIAAGLLMPVDGSLPSLEITTHRVKVVIEDGYAITTVDQIFHNPSPVDLEANYSFPIPEHGSVSELALWIDGKQVNGEVLEKQRARKIYQEEKAAGRDAGLTEQDSYKTFDTRVTPVRAHQDTRIRLVYMQPAHVDSGVGRYTYPLEEGGVDEEKIAFWQSNSVVKENFSFDLEVRSTYPVDAVRVPGRSDASITQQGPGSWRVALGYSANEDQQIEMIETESESLPPRRLATSAAFDLNKDIVVYWRHQVGLPGSVDLVAYKSAANERGTFMLTLTPGDDLEQIQGGRDWVFVLDISGSMQGKYATLADGVQRALGKLNPNDRFRLITFNSRAQELTSGFVAVTAETVRYYSDMLAAVNPTSGTNLYAGIKQGLASLDADRTSAIVLVTDGVANVGETAQRKFIEMLRDKDVRLFTMMMGNSANQPLLEALTRHSNGFAMSVSNSDDVLGRLMAAIGKVSYEAFHGVELTISGIKTADISPTRIASMYRGQQLVVFGHYWGDGPAEINLDGKISGQNKCYKTHFEFPSVASENPEIQRLWAFATIERQLAEINDFGEDPDRKQSVIDLALEYSLVTDYTSMLVVEDAVFGAHRIVRNNQARLKNEYAAREKRAQRSPVSRRVDEAEPMFRRVRPSIGSGSLDPWFSLGCLLLMIFASRMPWSSAKIRK